MKNALDLSEKIIGIVCIVFMALISILGILQVFFRYVIKNSLSFSEELMIFLFVWIIFLGAAICLRHGAHASVSMFIDKFSTKVKFIILVIGTLINIGFFGLLIIKGFEFAVSSHSQLSTALEIPMSYVYISIPIGSLFMMIYSFEYLYRSYIEMKPSWKESR